MATRTKSTTARPLREWAAPSDGATPLRVDRERRVVYGVRVLGPHSANGHGHPEATGGTAYTRACMEDALRLYEGAEVLCNHDLSPTGGRKARGVEDVLGVLRAPRVEDGPGGPCVRADLHYYESHPMAGRLVEEAERGVGGMGLSHDARAAKERFDPAGKRLVIERLASVASVDLVRKPATNRSLAESREDPPVTKTLRELVEALKLTPVRQKWAARLLEDDGMAGPVEAPVEAEADPDEALKAGFRAAVLAVLDAEDMDAAAKVAKIKTLLTTHEKLVAAEEPAEPVAEAEEEPDGDEAPAKKTDDAKTEALKELAALKAEKAVRTLCESLGFAPTARQAEDLALVADPAARRRLAESLKGAAARGTPARPTSSGPARPAPAPATVAEFVGSIKD